MQLSVGSYAYRVVVVTALRHPDTGDRVDGFCDWRSRRIWLDASLDAGQRRLTLRHEFFHAFEFAAGRTSTSEETADRAAWVNDELDRQLELLGGWGAVDALYRPELPAMPREAPPPCPPAPGRWTVSRFECRRCSAVTLVADVINAPARFDAELQRWTVRRGFTCHTCDCNNHWTEYATETGLLTGEAVPDRVPIPQGA